MSDKKIKCCLISPERPLFEGDVDHVVLTTERGELGVYPGHAALVTTLGVGEVRVTIGGDKQRYAIRGGFAQIQDNQINVLVDAAIRPEEIKSEALAKEEADLKAGKRHSDEEFDDYFKSLDWVRARRRVSSSTKPR